MAKLTNLLRGTVTLTACGPFPERLINLCAQQGVPFWGLEWPAGDTVRLTTRRAHLARLRRLAARLDCELTLDARRGLPFFLARFRKRYAFLLGLALSLLAVSVLSGFVLVVEVEGNQRVSTAAILTELRRQGLRPGVYGPGLERGDIAQQTLVALKGLSWMTVNLQGTRAVVLVRETLPVPEPISDDGFFHIVAETDGIVLHIEPEQGDAAVAEGDTVAKGDVLITGVVTVEPPRYSQAPARSYPTHARGRVQARTWRTLTAKIPLTADIKDYTGEEKTLWSFSLFERRIPLGRDGGAGEGNWEKTTCAYPLELPGIGVMPFSFTIEKRRAYERVSAEINHEAAQALLEEELLARLTEKIGKDGRLLAKSYTARVGDGTLEVTLLAECMEEIGTEAPASPSDLPPEELLLGK